MKSDFEKCSIDISSTYYPNLLKNIYDPPDRLFFRGNKKIIKYHNLLTIVGSRQTTDYHQSVLKHIIADLQDSSLVIVSGLATGIDGLAHRYALEYNLPTIAVLGSSLDEAKIYPKENLSLANTIIARGGLLLSEQSPETQTQLWHFPRRNRILAGISRATLVISGAKKSGTLITAQVALDEGREIFALPGNINSTLSYGPNSLIAGGAQLLNSARDILEFYGIKSNIKKQKIIFKNKGHAKIYSLLQTEPLSLVKLAAALNLPQSHISAMISEMEILGLIKFNQFNQVEIL